MRRSARLVGLILAGELIVVLGGYAFAPKLAGGVAKPIPDLAARSNTAALGDILYTDYIYYFQIAGLVLLVAMIGAIVLTLRHKRASSASRSPRRSRARRRPRSRSRRSRRAGASDERRHLATS